MSYKTGALKDPVDSRDWTITSFFRRCTAILPTSIDYSLYSSEVRDQGMLGSCVGFAATEIKTIHEARDINKKYVFSPLFIYWLRENQSIEGMYLRDAMKILAEYGVCQENLLPYKQYMASRGTLKKVHFDNAKNFKIAAYARISTVDEMRAALVETGPFIIAIPVYDSFFSVSEEGKIPIPDIHNEKIHGGHALAVVGYNDETKMFKVKNSWGTKWGNKGWGYLPYEFIEQYLWDAWSLVDAPSKPPTARLSIFDFFKKLWYTGVVHWQKMIILLFVIGMIIYVFCMGKIIL